MKKIKVIEQNEHSECGLSCANMILNYYNFNVDLITLREKYGVPVGGYNLKNISDLLNDFGLKSKGIKIDVKSIKQSMLPSIAFWEDNHFVVIEKITRNNIIIVDPDKGRQKLSISDFDYKFKNILLYVNKIYDTQLPIKENKSYLKKEIVKQISTNKIQYSLIIFLSFIVQGVSLLFSLIMKPLIDSGNSINIGKPFFLISIVFLLYFLTQITRSYILEKLNYSFNLKLNKDYVKKIVSLPLSFFINRSSGDIVYRYNLVSYIQQILDTHLLRTSMDIIFSIIYIYVMLSLSPHLAIFTICIATLIIIITFIHNKYLLDFNDKKMQEQSNAQSTFMELLHGIETIKSIGIEKGFFDNWKKHFTKYQDITYKSNIVSSWLVNIIDTLQFSLPFLIIVLGKSIQQYSDLSWGTIISFSTLSVTFIQPISELTNIIGQAMIVDSYVKKIDEVLIQKDYIASSETTSIKKLSSIKFENINFSYSFFEESILKNIFFSIEKEEKIAIVGPSGSGKSTFLKIISGLYKKNSGNITINDSLNLDNIDFSEYNKKVLYVPQTTTIFNMTLLENILLNETDVDPMYVNKVLRDTTLDELIESLPQKEMTKISEDGMNLSGGQKQKIAIARALLREPDVLLLDESTSSLDNISEEKIISSFKEYKTSIIFISHRLSTISHFDKIVVMNDGGIEDFGTHEYLVKNNKLYSSLYE